MIVDASVVVKWFTTEPLHAEARELLLGSEPILAPDFLVTEVANAMWSKTQRGEIDAAAAQRALAAISGGSNPILAESAPHVSRAYELAISLKHPVYDCVYLALAESLSTVLITADRRFFAAAAGHQSVRLLESSET